MRQFKAVIFDMDGLLLDTETIALSAFLETCEKFGLETRMDLFMRCLGTNQSLGEEVLREGLGGHIDHLQFGQVWDSKYIESTSNGPIPLKEGADSENGVRAALSAGITVVQIPDLLQRSADFRDLVHIVLRSLTEVTTYPFPRKDKAHDKH